ncbi:MAG: gamma-glutamyltransferase family protein [Actinomycetota bacterium]|nr:gamma-glutamyltransferase family protein [Actinomycetota bacterium]
MVASTHWLASAAGMAILERGGNAFDAAVATGLTLQVVEPHLNGPGGDLPIVLYSADRDEPLVVCGQGVAPAAATIERFSALGLELVPGTGFLPACVPGAFDAWMLLLLEFGTKRLADVMEFAIGYAEHGYPLLPTISASIERVQRLFEDEWRTSAEVYLRDGVPEAHFLFRNRDLAATYRRLVEEAERASGSREGQIEAARDAFYRGFVAERIVSFCETTEAMDSSGRRHRGLLSGDDLASWRATLERPVAYDYHGYTVFKTGPWGQGPVFLQQLGLLGGFDVETMAPGSAELVHTVVECAKLAFADREAWYGDPDFVDVPLEELLSSRYADERRALVGDAASGDLRPGNPGGREARLPAGIAPMEVAAGIGEPTRGDTCHLDVADRFGNLVSATPSGGWLQSSPVVPGLGFPLGTRGQMFWLEEGLPNSLAPRKRPRTTLSPSLAFRDGDPYLAFGTPGGDQQDQWPLVFFLNHVDFAANLQQAIDAPSWHTNHFPSSFYPREARPRHVEVEARLDARVLDELRERGHDVDMTGDWSLGRISAAAREPDGMLKAAANPRGMQGYAVGR